MRRMHHHSVLLKAKIYLWFSPFFQKTSIFFNFLSHCSVFTCVYSRYRKISAHEFERGGLLKPIVNTIDGTPTFLSIGTPNDCSLGTNTSGANTSNGNGSVGSNSLSSGGIGAGGPGGFGGNSTTGTGGSGSYHHSNHHYTQSGSGSHSHHHHHHNHYRPQRLSRSELKQLDEKELIFELVRYCLIRCRAKFCLHTICMN